MNFQEIQALLKHNPNASDWGHIQQENGTVAFCLEDVNLRLSLLVVWQNAKPYMSIELLYASTTLLSFSIPVGLYNDVADMLTDVLHAAVEKIEMSVKMNLQNGPRSTRPQPVSTRVCFCRPSGRRLFLSANANSLHRLYRDRLSNAFLFDPNKCIAPHGRFGEEQTPICGITICGRSTI